MLKTRFTLTIVVVAAGLILAASAGLLPGRKDKARNCGAGIRPRSVIAVGIWTKSGWVNINGYIGPTSFNKRKLSGGKFTIPAQACPGETARIAVQAIDGPFPSLVCRLEVGGTSLSGNAIQHEGVAGVRQTCTAVIP
jgi:hypothetical protein